MGLPTVRKIIGRAKAKGLIETWNVKGPYTKQAHEISKNIVDFFFHVHCELGLVTADSMYIVIEDFHLRMLSADLSPIWVTAGIECLLADRETGSMTMHGVYTKQMPSEAKGFVSDDMLRMWGLWRRHTPHQRDVIRHMARKLDILLQEQS